MSIGHYYLLQYFFQRVSCVSNQLPERAWNSRVLSNFSPLLCTDTALLSSVNIWFFVVLLFFVSFRFVVRWHTQLLALLVSLVLSLSFGDRSRAVTSLFQHAHTAFTGVLCCFSAFCFIIVLCFCFVIQTITPSSVSKNHLLYVSS